MATSGTRAKDPKPSRPSPPTHVLETCLYVRSMQNAVAFYQDILGLTPALSAPRLTMFPMGLTSLILFQLGLTEEDSVKIADSTGEKLTVPGHGPDPPIVQMLMKDDSRSIESAETAKGMKLKTHFCLAVPTRDEVVAWESYLKEKSVMIRGVMEWERGGRSVYFEDADGHIGEIGSRGIWEHY